MSLVVVPTDSPGVSVERQYDKSKLGNWSCDHAELMLRDVVVPRNNVIGPAGSGMTIQMEHFQRERLVEAIMTHAQARALVQKTKQFAKQRIVFGQPLINLQAVAYRLVDMETDLDFLRGMSYRCVEAFMSGRECTRDTAMLKLKAARRARELGDECFTCLVRMVTWKIPMCHDGREILGLLLLLGEVLK